MAKRRSGSTREMLHKVCLHLIYKKGFKGTTMRDIAQEMNMEAASIYNYIDSKSALLEEWLFDLSKAFHLGIDHILQSSYDPKEKIRSIISLHLRITVSDPYKAALLTNEWRNLTGVKQERFVAERNQYESKVQQVIEEGISAGQLSSLHPAIMTQTMLASLRWLFQWYIVHKDEMNPVELEKQLTEVIMKGILN